MIGHVLDHEVVDIQLQGSEVLGVQLQVPDPNIVSRTNYSGGFYHFIRYMASILSKFDSLGWSLISQFIVSFDIYTYRIILFFNSI